MTLPSHCKDMEDHALSALFSMGYSTWHVQGLGKRLNKSISKEPVRSRCELNVFDLSFPFEKIILALVWGFPWGNFRRKEIRSSPSLAQFLYGSFWPYNKLLLRVKESVHTDRPL